MSELVELGARNPGLWVYLGEASREWPWAGPVVLGTLARSRGRVLGLVQDGELAAGALLSPMSANVFLEGDRRRLARDLCTQGYANLSYLVVRRDRRGQGLGSQFIQAVAAEHSFWLACERELAGFYRGCGLEPSALDPAFHFARAAP